MHIFSNDKLPSKEFAALEPMAKILLKLSSEIENLKNDGMCYFFRQHYPQYRFDSELDRKEIAQRGRFAEENANSRAFRDGIRSTFFWDGKPVFALVTLEPYTY